MITLVDCGCETKVHRDGSGVEVYHCTLHAAAPELLEACEKALAHFGRLMEKGALTREEEPALEGLRAALAKARGE